MKLVLSLILFCMIIFLTCCSFNTNTKITQKDEVSYLKLIGDMENVTMQIDDDAIIKIDPEKEDVIYQLKPGTHIVTIYKDDKLVVKRKLYFDDSITKEIEVK